MAKINFKDRYCEERKKEEFYTEPEQTQMTDESQLCQASIVEMAKKFGIDAIIAKAKQTEIDDNLKNQLYGHDFSDMFKSREDRLKVKNKLNNVFENIPAQMRKELFHDDVTKFVDAYVTNDIEKLTGLNKVGIVSDSQLQQVKDFNAKLEAQKREIETRKAFMNKLNEVNGDLYENYKKTGNITINSSENSTPGNTNV